MKYAKYLIFIVCAAATIGFLSARFWATNKSLEFEGPSFVQLSPDQNSISILIQDTIFSFDSSNSLVGTLDLTDFGKSIAGTFDYFSNGDILFYHYAKETSLFDKIAIYLRLQSLNTPFPSGEEGFFRCSPSSMICSEYTRDIPALGQRAHGIEIDLQTDEVYISATERFELFKLSADGQLLARNSSGFQFPNLIKYFDGQLYVADTNNHEIKIVDASTESFGEVVRSHETTIAGTSYQWPSVVEPGAGAWWVLINDNGMGWGRVVRFEQDWSSRSVLELPQNAWPVGITYFDEALWVADLERMEVHRFSETGQKLANLSHPELDAMIASQKEQQGYFQQISYYCLVGMILSLILGLVGIYVFDRENSTAYLKGALKGSKKGAGESIKLLEIAEGETKWFKPNYARSNLIVSYMMQFMAGLQLLFCVFLVSGFNLESLSLLFVVACFSAMLFFCGEMFKHQSKLELGLSNDKIFLKQQNGQVVARLYKEVIYSGNQVLVGDKLLLMGTKARPLFPEEALSGFLKPALVSGQSLHFLPMQLVLLKLGEPVSYLNLCALILLIATLVF